MIIDHTQFYQTLSGPDIVLTFNAKVVITGLGNVYNAEALLVRNYYDIDIINGYQEAIAVDNYHSIKIL